MRVLGVGRSDFERMELRVRWGNWMKVDLPHLPELRTSRRDMRMSSAHMRICRRDMPMSRAHMRTCRCDMPMSPAHMRICHRDMRMSRADMRTRAKRGLRLNRELLPSEPGNHHRR